MSDQTVIKDTFDGLRDIFQEHPDKANITKGVYCELISGLRAEVRYDNHVIPVDMPASMGGSDTASNPGGLARAALASCLAIGYAVFFARRGLVVDRIKVDVEADLDVRGSIGFDGIPPEFSALRCSVQIASDEEPEAIRAAVAATEAASPILNSFAKPIPIKTQLDLRSTKAVAR